MQRFNYQWIRAGCAVLLSRLRFWNIWSYVDRYKIIQWEKMIHQTEMTTIHPLFIHWYYHDIIHNTIKLLKLYLKWKYATMYLLMMPCRCCGFAFQAAVLQHMFACRQIQNKHNEKKKDSSNQEQHTKWMLHWLQSTWNHSWNNITIKDLVQMKKCNDLLTNDDLPVVRFCFPGCGSALHLISQTSYDK